jgi:hypothetical protein
MIFNVILLDNLVIVSTKICSHLHVQNIPRGPENLFEIM